MPRRTKSAKIDTRSARTKLIQRREPHWARIARGCALGYRKGKSGGTWIARWQSPDGRKNYQAIGKADDAIEADGGGVLSFDQAQDRARDWFQQVGRGEAGIDNGLTVQECIEDYLDYLRRERSALTAYDSEKRAARYILPPLGQRRLADLTTVQIRRWRDSLVSSELDGDDRRRAQDSANRILTILKAALNRAWREGRVSDDTAWRRVKPFEGVGESRKVFLSQTEGQRLVNACHDSALRNLVAAGLLTGARLGELTAAHVADVDFTGRRDTTRNEGLAAKRYDLCRSAVGPVRGAVGFRLIHDARDGVPARWNKDTHSVICAANILRFS